MRKFRQSFAGIYSFEEEVLDSFYDRKSSISFTEISQMVRFDVDFKINIFQLL